MKKDLNPKPRRGLTLKSQSVAILRPPSVVNRDVSNSICCVPPKQP